MMENLISLLLFSISITLTPGPNNFMLMNSGLNFGSRKSLPHYLGVAIGFPLMFLVVALGFGVIFQQYTWIKEILKILGSAYMLYLAYCIAMSDGSIKSSHRNKPFSFLQAALFQWINPKAWLAVISAISIYTLSTNYFHNAILISLIFLFISFPCGAIWLFLGENLKHFLKSDKHRRLFNFVMAAALVASIAMILLE